MSNSIKWLLVGAVTAIYGSLVVATLLTKLPWIDEAWVANPVWNWMENGAFVTSFFEPANPGGLRTFEEHTYWMPPVWFLIETVWFYIWGVGIFQQRVLSALFGGVALLAVYFFTGKVTNNQVCGFVATILLAVDFIFLNHAADGRMDMMVCACTFSAYALYVNLREKNLGYALLASNCAIALGGLTNPIGIIGAVGLGYLIAFDLTKLSVKSIFLAAVPYLVGGILWSLHILQNPAEFSHQFFGKTPSPGWSPVPAIYREIAERYFPAYAISPDFGILSGSQFAIGCVYMAALLASILWAVLKRDRMMRLLVGLWCAEFLGMAILISIKSFYHLPQIIPLYVIFVAYWLVRISGSFWRTRIAVALGLILFIGQLRIAVLKIAGNPYRNDFVPVVEAVRNAGPNGVVFATPEIGFATGFPSWVTYDVAFGYFSGKKPDLVVLRVRQREFKDIAPVEHPEALPFVERLFTEEMQLLFENSSYRVFGRKKV